MELVKQEKFEIENTGLALQNGFDENVAGLVLDSVNALDNCRQWVLGDWWNECQRAGVNGRKLLEEKGMGDQYGKIRNYGAVAGWCDLSNRCDIISFTSHYECYMAGAEHRDKLLAKASKGKWPKRRVIEEASKLKGRPVRLESKERVVPIAETNEFKKQLDERLDGRYKGPDAKVFGGDYTKAEQKQRGVTRSEALEFFGIDPLTHDTVEIIFRSLSKIYHPDSGGDASDFDYLVKCRERLEAIAR